MKHNKQCVLRFIDDSRFMSLYMCQYAGTTPPQFQCVELSTNLCIKDLKEK